MSILNLQSDVWWGLGLISRTWQVLFSGSLKGSQTTGSEEESYVLPASSGGPDHWRLQVLHVKLLTW